MASDMPTGTGTLEEFQQDLVEIAAGRGPLPAQKMRALASRGIGRYHPEMKKAQAQLTAYFVQRYGRAMMDTMAAVRGAAGAALRDRLEK